MHGKQAYQSHIINQILKLIITTDLRMSIKYCTFVLTVQKKGRGLEATLDFHHAVKTHKRVYKYIYKFIMKNQY